MKVIEKNKIDMYHPIHVYSSNAIKLISNLTVLALDHYSHNDSIYMYLVQSVH